jgi:hypothetical protein
MLIYGSEEGAECHGRASGPIAHPANAISHGYNSIVPPLLISSARNGYAILVFVPNIPNFARNSGCK